MHQGTSEDDVVSSLIEVHQSSNGEASIYPEKHYNHYGDRGVVDLFVELETTHGETRQWLYEIKSEAALRDATGANEVLRQFNRMREFFFKGTDHEPGSQVFYQLIIVPTVHTLRHISDNFAIYDEVIEFEETPHGKIRETSLSLAHSNMGWRGGVHITNGITHATESELTRGDPELAAELADTFDVICSDGHNH